MIRVGVVGAGLIGRERLSALAALKAEGKPVSICGLYDANPEACRSVASSHAIPVLTSLSELLDARPDWVMIALPHDVAVTAALQALDSGSSVLLEKPMGRDLHEAEQLMRAGSERLRIGFNYRFYKGIAQAVQDVRNGRFGKIVSIEFELGHGCAPGQEKTWKLNERSAGGGCLIDPGVHLLDICLQLAPHGLKPIGGTSWNGFWKTGIEEEACVLLDAGGFPITVRVSIVSWRSTFIMRINGTDGYGIVTGRNRSYGNQVYTVGKRWGWLEAPSQAASEVVEVVDDGTDVFKRETETILFGEDKTAWPRDATAADALAVMRLLDEIRASLGLRRAYSS